jgi:predicted Zn-dependent protease
MFEMKRFESRSGHWMLRWGMRPDCWRDVALAAEQPARSSGRSGHPQARLILGVARRHAGLTQARRGDLEPLAREQPHSLPAHIELGIAYGESGRVTEAIAVLRRALQLKPDSSDAWRLLADQLDAIGDADGADRARAAHIKAGTKDPRLMAAATALVANDLSVAEARLRAHLKAFPTDVAALRMLAEVAIRLKRYPEGQILHCSPSLPRLDTISRYC